MWLGKTLQYLGEQSPYIHGDNPDNDIVTPEVDTK